MSLNLYNLLLLVAKICSKNKSVSINGVKTVREERRRHKEFSRAGKPNKKRNIYLLTWLYEQQLSVIVGEVYYRLPPSDVIFELLISFIT